MKIRAALVEIWKAGQLELEEMLTRSYGLDGVNQGYADTHAGLNVRGLISLER